MNRFVSSLTSVCQDHLLEEKLLIASSLRIGHQWVELVARHGRGVLNLAPTTMMGLALKIAGPVIAKKGLKIISAKGIQVLINDSWTRTIQEKGGYFSSLKPSTGLIEVMAKAVRDLRLAGLAAEDLNPDSFTTASKGREIISLVEDYGSALGKNGLTDYAGVLALAVSILEKDPPAARNDIRILIPDDANFGVLEQQLLELVPDRVKIILPFDNPEPDPEKARERLCQSPLLKWKTPGEDTNDDPELTRVAMFNAVGEINEIRGLLRRCLAAKIPFDSVEVLHTDTGTYVPLIFETIVGHTGGGSDLDNLPVTFAEGIPASMSRPGRALSSLILWSRSGWSVSALSRMLSDGLLTVTDNPRDIPFARLAALLQKLVPAGGRDTILSMLDRQAAALKRRVEVRQPDEEGEAIALELANDLEAALVLRGFIHDLLAALPDRWGDPAQTLKCAETFLNDFARCADRLDGYGQKHLVEEICEMTEWVGMFPKPFNLNITQWLAGLPEQVRIAGSGPLPGKIHVAHLLDGGHSGRSNTYIVGLDEGRFPGAGLQDPILLDAERRRLSGKLRPSQDLNSRKTRDFYRLLSRLRGEVTMSFSARDLTEDRDILPSSVILYVYRELADPGADLAGMMKKLQQISFTPEDSAGSLGRGEWLLGKLLGKGEAAEPDAFLSEMFPHLARGRLARRRRMCRTATPWDGLLTRCGPELDPTGPEGPVMSSTRFETLGTCPLSYFFRYILEISPPEKDPDRSIWLNNMDYGSLLHRILYRFMDSLVSEGLRPDFVRDEGRLLDVLEEEIAAKRKVHPPLRESSMEKDMRRLTEAARMFLREEEKFCRNHEPLFLEASIGIPGEGHTTQLDSDEPVHLELPGGRTFRARGRLDRIDRLDVPDGEQFVVTDYKSGSDTKYRKTDPFWQGRVIQHALYLALADHRLSEAVSPSARVSSFRFLFPSEKARSESMTFAPEDLSRSGELLSYMCEIAARGIFLPTIYKNDCGSCDYLGNLCESDPEALISAAGSKLENPENTNLDPVRAMRGK